MEERKKIMGTKTPSKILHMMTDFDLDFDLFLGAVQAALLQERAVGLGEEGVHTHPQERHD